MNAVDKVKELALIQAMSTGDRYLDALYHVLTHPILVRHIQDEIIKTDADVEAIYQLDVETMQIYAEYKAKMIKAGMV